MSSQFLIPRVLFLFLIFLPSFQAAVVDLTALTFDKTVDGSSNVLVEFYTPWCPHCQKLSPTYEEVGAAFQQQDDVIIARVNLDVESNLGTKFSITGLPTLLWFPQGSTQPARYDGSKDANSIVRWVTEKTGPPKTAPMGVLDLTAASFSRIVDGSVNVLVEFYAPWCPYCQKLTPDYEMVGRAFDPTDGVIIARVNVDQEYNLGTQFRISGLPTLLWFSRGSTQPDQYDGSKDASGIISWVKDRTGDRKQEL